MQEAIKDMELQREALYKKLQEVGDFRRGIVSANYRKCGKKNCACAKKGHSGHGPQYLWNATIDGKSRAKNLKLGSEVQKYLQDTENYRKFVGLCEEIIQVNERICDLRPVAVIEDNKELQELKKNLQRHFMKKYRKRLIKQSHYLIRRNKEKVK